MRIIAGSNKSPFPNKIFKGHTGTFDLKVDGSLTSVNAMSPNKDEISNRRVNFESVVKLVNSCGAELAKRLIKLIVG